MKYNSYSDISIITSPSYWDDRAPDYALPSDKESIERADKIINVLAARGLSIDGAAILDIGCGTGNLSLPLAQRGAQVTGIDISESMLMRLKAEAEGAGINNIRTILGSWNNVDTETENLTASFDIVISSLSIALRSRSDLIRMDQCSRNHCVCIACGEIRRSMFYEALLSRFNLPMDPIPDIRSIRKELDLMKREHSYDFFTVTREKRNTLDELAADIAEKYDIEGIKPDIKSIKSRIYCLLPGIQDNDSILCRSWSDIGIAIWKSAGPHSYREYNFRS
jgi:SAM-dependent methyltransferase